MSRSSLVLLCACALTAGWFLAASVKPQPEIPSTEPVPKAPAPKPKPKPKAPCPDWHHRQADGPSALSGWLPCDEACADCQCGYGCDCHIATAHQPQLGGKISPDGTVQISLVLDSLDWPKNITSRGLGCCGSRSLDYAARLQNVPELVGLPEKMRRDGIAGGDNFYTIRDKMKRYAPDVSYWQDTSGSLDLLEAAVKSRRLPGIDYSGRDPHYSGRIAHCVNCVACDQKADWVAILDNNYPSLDQIVWMDVASFKQRWMGWSYGLLAPVPGHCADGIWTVDLLTTADKDSGPVFGFKGEGHPWGNGITLDGQESTTEAIIDAIGEEMVPKKIPPIEIDHKVDLESLKPYLFGAAAGAVIMVLLANKNGSGRL